MARTKQASRKGSLGAVVVDREPMPDPLPSAPDSKIPSVLRFPLVTLLSLVTSFALRTVTSEFSLGDLATITKQRDEWVEITGFVGWKVADLAVAWWLGYDAWDAGSLTFLAHLPHYYLLVLCYGIRPTTSYSSILIDVVSSALPFYLLRQLSPQNSSRAPKSAVANRPVVKDRGVQTFTSLAAAGVYAVVIYGSVRSWLPVFLITHFEGLRDLEGVYNAEFATIVVGCMVNGIAAMSFVFTPSMGATPDSHDAKNAAFNPATATFGETVKHNLWGHSKRTRILIQRTLTVAVSSASYTFLQTYFVLDGAEATGAAGWAAMWASAAVLTGMMYWWIGDAKGVVN